MALRLGVDVGGTFTDAALVDEETGAGAVAKVPTTPADPSLGFLRALERVLAAAGAEAASAASVVHATTVATNAIIEGSVARTGFVTTEGFRDLLEIARQVRPSLYDTRFEKPPPLVPRERAVCVRERLGPAGEVVTPLEPASVEQAAALLQAAGVESVAVCLLHAYRNGEHERRVAAILAERLPGVPISLSSEVAPEFREYRRASTTVVNAALRPLVERYLARVEQRLAAAGLTARLLVMQSSGGVFDAHAAARRPVFMLESGPAAGVIAAAELGAALGHANVLSFDMGGTTAKVGLIRDGQPSLARDYQVGGRAGAAAGGHPLGGYPLATPVVDLVEIGAGGGSIAWVDSGGLLRIGPRSAGADPGPACYGRGGREPTVTDANAVLGRLGGGRLLGEEIALDLKRAHAAIDERCARPLGLDVVAAASGIVEIANAAMAGALNRISVERGHDPRDFVLYAFGGAGPLHANALARECAPAALLIPPAPGIFSARGLLATDLRHEASVTLLRPLERLDPSQAEAAFAALERAGAEELEREGVPPAARDALRELDLRYVGQSSELTVAAPTRLDGASAARLRERFDAEHERAYGFCAPEEPVECVSLRLTSVGRLPRPPRALARGGTATATPIERRPVHFAEAGGFVDCPVYERAALRSGSRLEGPALVEEFDATSAVHPGYAAELDAYGNLVVRPSR